MEKTYEVELGKHINNQYVDISMHVDSIQAMLVYCSTHRDSIEDFSVMGRRVSELGDTDRIIDDPLYMAFTALRSNTRREFFRSVAHMTDTPAYHFRNPKLRATDSSTNASGGFPVVFYRAHDLVDEWQSGETTPIKLMPRFGGLTELTFGSNDLSLMSTRLNGLLIKTSIVDKQINGMNLTDHGISFSDLVTN